jgi:hypothetical protein
MMCPIISYLVFNNSVVRRLHKRRTSDAVYVYSVYYVPNELFRSTYIKCVFLGTFNKTIARPRPSLFIITRVHVVASVLFACITALLYRYFGFTFFFSPFFPFSHSLPLLLIICENILMFSPYALCACAASFSGATKPTTCVRVRRVTLVQDTRRGKRSFFFFL